MNDLVVLKAVTYFVGGLYVGFVSLSYQLSGTIEALVGVGAAVIGGTLFVTRQNDALAQRLMDFGQSHAKSGFVDLCFGRGLWTISNSIAEFVLGNTTFSEEEHQQKIVGDNYEYKAHH